MNQFRFGLDGVLAWRRTQARFEEVRLETLHTELRNLATHAEKVSRERHSAGRLLLASGSATGVELAFLDSFHKAADVELARFETAGADCRRRADAQMESVTLRRRDVKLLERLRERRVDAWLREHSRETERDAAELLRQRRDRR
jgi:hypothetical protein